MSDCLNIKSSIHDYKVFFVDDFSLSIKKQIIDGDFILIDQTIYDLYRQNLAPILDRLNHIIIKPSEEQKSYLNLAPIIELLIQKILRRIIDWLLLAAELRKILPRLSPLPFTGELNGFFSLPRY